MPHFSKNLLLIQSGNKDEEYEMTNNLREVIRLIGKTNFSNHAIGRLTGFSHNTISKYRQKLRDSGRQIDAVLEFNDRQLKAMFVGARGFSAEKRMPDWNFIHSKMQARHQTLIQLWEEYCLENTSDAYSYSQFTYYYRDYINRIDICMRQVYYAGHTGLVDYAGRTIEWYDHKNKTSKHAQIFIGVLGCSNYTFVHASDSQKLEHWIDSHTRMFEYFGGVPYVIISDNLKSAVTKPGPFPVINRSYLECIRHYGTAIDPARAGHPQDKAKVEGSVLCVSRWVIAALSQRQFFSIDEINIAILELLEKFNNRKFKRLPGTRRSRFEELDKPLLKPLPSEPFQYSEWVTEQKVPPDYHIYVKQHAYSVPYQLVSEKVEARITLRTVEIFHLSKRIATHERCDTQGDFTTNPLHRPPQHQAYAALTAENFCKWAERVGPASTQVIKAQLDKNPEHSVVGRKACAQLENLSRTYGEVRFEAACLRAVEICSLTVKSVRSILQHHMELIEDDLPVQSELPLHYHLRGAQYYQEGRIQQ